MPRTARSQETEPRRPGPRAALVMLALGALLVLGPASARVPPAERSGAVEDAVVFFDTLALTRPNPDGIAEAGWVRRWQGPVAVTLEGARTPGLGEAIAESLAELSAWTGLRFRLVDGPVAGDHIAIRIQAPRARYGAGEADGAVCLTTTIGTAGRLHRAVIDIGPRHLDCIDHELMHALGFGNHWHGAGVSRPIASVLAPRRSADRRAAFSPADILAIRTLYHADLAPGLARSAALRRVRTYVAARDADKIAAN